ncbi:MAG: flavin reductase family protein [Parvularculaceae bacterium]
MADAFRALKRAFSRYGTGVTIVSCQPPKKGKVEGKPIAITVNSFTSVSLEPPLVLWCIEKRSGVFDAYMDADNYAVTVLRQDQQEVSARFARQDNHDFEKGEFETWITGAPILKQRMAAFDCKVIDRIEAGDHVILLGHVLKYDHRDGEPLLYVGGSYVDGPEIN